MTICPESFDGGGDGSSDENVRRGLCRKRRKSVTKTGAKV